MSNFLYTITLLLISTFSFAQEKCLSYQIIEKQISDAINPQTVIEELNALKNNDFIPTKAGVIIKIPVVFHIIHNGDEVGDNENISDSIVLEQIKRLNTDFRAFNADTANIPNEFKPFLADCEIEFCLAKKDVNNDFTSGITRHFYNNNNHLENFINTTIKPATVWDRNNYLNIWSVMLTNNSVNGYATPPFTSTNILEDGIVLNYTKVGNDIANDIGRTLTHEVGHWLGLMHIWGDDSGACTGDDGINDTPNQADAYQNCPSGIPNSCGSNDMYINYMDYTDADCAFMFTQDQKTRMHSVLNGFRSSILTSSACKVSDIIIEEILFPNGTICQEYFTPAIKIKNIGFDTIYNFSFDFYIDNTFISSKDINKKIAPNQIFYAKRNYSSTNTLGMVSEAKFIISTSGVEYDSNNEKTSNFSLINTGAGYATLSEDFESTSFPPTNIFIQNPNNDTTWTQFSAQQNNCTFIHNAINTNKNIDAFSTTDINPFEIVDVAPFLFFDYLYKTRPGYSDTLTIYYSIDCGVHWFPIWSKNGMELSRNQTDTNTFIYDNETLFKDSIPLSNITYEVGKIKKVRFLFENKSGGGNNLYIDNINLEYKIVGIIECPLKFPLAIFPNPTNDLITISFEEEFKHHIELFSPTGIKLFETETASHYIDISLKNYPKGIYLLRLENKGDVSIHKILKY